MATRAPFARWIRIAALGLAALSLLAALEAQLPAYGASLLRQEIRMITHQPDTSPPPQDVLASLTRPDQNRLTILAVGDIARCARTDLPGRLLPATTDQLGWHRPMIADHADPQASARLAATWPAAPILALGDLAYARGTPAEFADCFDGAWGSLRPRILPAPGNHEYGTPGAFGYFDYWGAQAGPDRRGYYALRWRNWLMLSLNSEVDAAPGSPQAIWLAQELAQARARAPEGCIMAFFHKPAHSPQGPRHDQHNAERLFAQVQQAGASFVIHGHNHIYERSPQQDSSGAAVATGGTMAFTVGTGGVTAPGPQHASQNASQTGHPGHSHVTIQGTIGLLRMELSDHGFAWWFHQAADGAVLDHGRATCGPGDP